METTNAFRERLEHLLRERFGGMDIDLEPLGQTGRLSGVLIWDGFQGLDFVDRQERIWSAIRDAFKADATQVSTLITLTPAEAAED
jgi:acid stress-induced BolA-like protein IbaG/YrbA